MQVNFINDKLKNLYMDPNIWKWYYPPWVIKNYIKVVTLMYTVNNVNSINNYGRYQIEQKKWVMKWIRAARLNDWRRLEFTRDKDWDIQIVNLIKITNHYE